MFDEDDDFEIDEEFLGGVFDAERSAVTKDDISNISLNSPNDNSDLESPPPKKKKQPVECASSLPENLISARRTSEESARLVALSVRRSAPASDLHQDRSNRTNIPSSPETSSCNFFKLPESSPKNYSSGRLLTNGSRKAEASFTLNTSRVRQRKFPGPAGLLPERERSHAQRTNFSSLLNTSSGDFEETEEPLSFCSQSSASVLEEGPWAALQSDLRGEGQGLLLQYTVSWVKHKAAARQLVGQKVPFLAAVLHSIDCSSPDPCVVLRDATGEIPGTLHRSVWDSFGGQLIAGSALVLRLVGVLSTGISARRHYLNITSNNIVTIYSSPLCESFLPDPPNNLIFIVGVRKTDVHKWTINQLLQTANSWEDQSKKKKTADVHPRPTNAVLGNMYGQNKGSNYLASARPPLQTSNRNMNIHCSNSTLNISAGPVRDASLPRPPSQQSPKSTCFPRASVPNSNVHNSNVSFARPPLPSSSTQNPNLLRPASISSINSTTSNQSKFVLKKPLVSAGKVASNAFQPAITQSLPSELHQVTSGSQASSKDLFSDDDLDISSVLDGIDTESLFGDF